MNAGSNRFRYSHPSFLCMKQIPIEVTEMQRKVAICHPVHDLLRFIYVLDLNYVYFFYTF